MGVKPETSGEVVGSEVSIANTYGRYSLRWKCYYNCPDISKKVWNTYWTLQIKKTGGLLLPANRLRFVDSDGERIGVGASDLPNDSNFQDVFLEGKTSYFITENGKRVETFKVYDLDTVYVTTHSVQLGRNNVIDTVTARPVPPRITIGADYTKPTIEDIRATAKDTHSITVSYTIKAPYDFTTTVSCGGTSYQDNVEISQPYQSKTLSKTFSELDANSRYYIRLLVECDNTEKASQTCSATTNPIHVAQIVCPDDLYVNVGEQITITPTVKSEEYPTPPTNPYLRFRKVGELDTYYIDSYTTQSVTLKGGAIVDPECVLRIVSQDDNATKDVTIHVCVPATGIVCRLASKRVPIGGTYTIDYYISPEDTTDTNVTFTSSDTSVATVNSAGVVSGIASGDATITLSLATKSINADGTITSGTPITTQIAISVSDTPVYNEQFSGETLAGLTFYAYVIDQVFENYSALRAALNGYDYGSGVVDIVGFVSPETNGSATPLYEIVKCFNCIEDAMDKIYTATNAVPYMDTANADYGTSYRWGGLIENAEDKVKRIGNYMFDLYDFCLSHEIEVEN